ncbi:MAG TPA: cytochrome c peroxidase [Chitinophagaceae bacterium]|nr:cytochrome c peroxidase [Chitinophagaceae bacterium]
MRKSLLTIFILTLFIASLSWFLGACRKGVIIELHPLTLTIPTGFLQPHDIFANNPLTEEGFQLGRRLFYDGRLSVDGDHACASCHQQLAAFGTYQHDRSHGVHNSHTLRNAPVLENLAWQDSYHWDSAFTSLKEESRQPITGNVEMGEQMTAVIVKLRNDASYVKQFRDVFHSSTITIDMIEMALAQFTGSLISADSKYDRYKKGLATYTVQEENGYQIFKANCATCHPEPMFTDYSYRNIGLLLDNELLDYGKMRITGLKADSLKFKVPSLRNVYISSNYMHDGRFNTLAQCINHYRTGVQNSPSLDPLLLSGISLTNAQATDLAVFLRTLTDSAFLSAPRFSKPN